MADTAGVLSGLQCPADKKSWYKCGVQKVLQRAVRRGFDPRQATQYDCAQFFRQSCCSRAAEVQSVVKLVEQSSPITQGTEK